MIYIFMEEILNSLFLMPSIFKNFIFLFFFINQLAAQEVTLMINAPGYAGKKVDVWVVDDQFTGHQSLVGTKVLKNDLAKFIFKASNIELIRISLDYQYGMLLVEPNAIYNITFPVLKDRSILTLAGATSIQLIYNDLDSNDINFKLSELNERIDGFMLESIPTFMTAVDSSSGGADQDNENRNETYNLNRFSERELLKKVEAYHLSLDSIYSDENDYFNTYLEFVFANLELSLGKNRRKLFFEYLENTDIAYNNIEFVKFFKAFYADFFDFYSYYPYAEKLINAFESAQPTHSLLEIIKGDTLTGSDKMQRLVMLKGLYDLYPNTSTWKKKIIDILKESEKNNPYLEQRKIASYMIGNLLKGSSGSKVPEMKYLNNMGDTLYLSGMHGKMVYIQFFAGWNTSAIAEMELMVELKKRYGNLVEFLSISIDENFEDFTAFVNKNNSEFKWNFGWIGDDSELRNSFEVFHLPLFYLIDEQGYIISWPALWPSTGIESIFNKIKYSRKEKKKNGYWDSPSNKSNKDG